jgi:hypothetical protein
MSALKQSSPIEHLVQQAANLTRSDLLELQAAIDALAVATEPQIIDLDEARKERREATSAAPATPKGWIETSYKTVNGKTYGPYRYLRYRHGATKKSTYLGKVTGGPT